MSSGRFPWVVAGSITRQSQADRDSQGSDVVYTVIRDAAGAVVAEVPLGPTGGGPVSGDAVDNIARILGAGAST